MRETLDARQTRSMIRDQKWDGPTIGLAPGYTQANLVVLPRDVAYDFLLFAQRNPQSCPLLEVTDTGSPVPKLTAPEADLRYDLPKYRIYENGQLVQEVADLGQVWRDDFVSFLIGCSFTFEQALMDHGLSIRHLEQKSNVSMYETNIACEPAGVFHGQMVVSMRPFSAQDAIRAVQVTSRYPAVHGSPVHLGDPQELGIEDLGRPDFGDAVPVYEGEIPVFWACGVTPQAVAMSSKPELMITHAPGHMFITDQKDNYYSIL